VGLIMTLKWADPDSGGFLAHGAGEDYLIVWDAHMAVLTRWRRSSGKVAAARQAALNAIQLGGAYDIVPDVTEGVIARLKRAAQEYEAGLDVSAYPAWRH
jgi:hypothetical protein